MIEIGKRGFGLDDEACPLLAKLVDKRSGDIGTLL